MKKWLLYEDDGDGVQISLFCAAAIQLHRILLREARNTCKRDPFKAERLSRLAERRATDGEYPLILTLNINKIQNYLFF